MAEFRWQVRRNRERRSILYVSLRWRCVELTNLLNYKCMAGIVGTARGKRKNGAKTSENISDTYLTLER